MNFLRYQKYYFSFFILLITHFFITYIPRLIITTKAAKKIHNKIIGFPTIIIGNNSKAIKLYNDIENQEISSGNKIMPANMNGVLGTRKNPLTKLTKK